MFDLEKHNDEKTLEYLRDFTRNEIKEKYQELANINLKLRRLQGKQTPNGIYWVPNYTFVIEFRWKCDDGCCNGSKRDYDVHGSYSVACGKCNGDGWLNDDKIKTYEDYKRNGRFYY